MFSTIFNATTREEFMRSSKEHLGSQKNRTTLHEGSLGLLQDEHTIFGVVQLGVPDGAQAVPIVRLSEGSGVPGVYTSRPEYNKYIIRIKNFREITPPISFAAAAALWGVDNKMRNNIAKGAACSYAKLFCNNSSRGGEGPHPDEPVILAKVNAWILSQLQPGPPSALQPGPPSALP